MTSFVTENYVYIVEGILLGGAVIFALKQDWESSFQAFSMFFVVEMTSRNAHSDGYEEGRKDGFEAGRICFNEDGDSK